MRLSPAVFTLWLVACDPAPEVPDSAAARDTRGELDAPSDALSIDDGGPRDGADLDTAGADGGTDRDAAGDLDSGVDGGPLASDVGTGGSDAGHDGGVDAGRDGGVDGGRDGGVDAGRDGGVDGGRDGGRDAWGDTGLDAACGGSQRYCGGACRACPTTGVATTTCSGPACLAATCADGFVLSGGACVAVTCPAGQLYCTIGCSPCPDGSATFACSGPGACVATTCGPGLSLSLGECVTEGWTVELIHPLAETTWTVPYRLVLDRDGRPVVAFRVPSTRDSYLAISRREATGWPSVLSTAVSADPAEPIGAGVDASNGIYVAYDSGLGGIRLLHLSSDGTVVMNTRLGAGDDVSLAMDAAGDAHVVFEGSAGLAYSRTFERAVVPTRSLGFGWRGPVVAVDPDGTVHVSGHDRGAVHYTRAVAGVFDAPTSIPTTLPARSDGLIYSDGTTREFWFNGFLTVDPGVHYRVPLLIGGPTTPVRWAPSSGTTSDNVGARGPRGFAELNAAPTSYVYRSGDATTASFTERVQLLRGTSIVGNAVFDSAGRFHALLRRGSALFYVRRG